MPTPNILPRNDGEGKIGDFNRKWEEGYFKELHTEKLYPCLSFFLHPIICDEKVIVKNEAGIVRRALFNTQHRNVLAITEGYVQFNTENLPPDADLKAIISLQIECSGNIATGQIIIQDKVITTPRILTIPFSLSKSYSHPNSLGDVVITLELISDLNPLNLTLYSNNLRAFGWGFPT